MTPLQLKFLLHCYTTAEAPNRDPFMGANDPHRESELLLEKDGLIAPVIPTEGLVYFRTTPKGSAFVQMILDTPYPQEAFIDPRDGRPI